jgi:hypothetical protein
MQIYRQFLTPQNYFLVFLKKITEADKERRSTCGNITYTQAGVQCFVGQKSDIFEVQFFVGSLVNKIPACV